MFKNPFSNFCYCVFILFFVFSVPAFSASYVSGDVFSCTYRNDLPPCSPTIHTVPPDSTLAVNDSAVYYSSTSGSAYLAVIKGFCANVYQGETFVSGGLITNTVGAISLNSIRCNYVPTAECLPPNQIYNGECITPVETPQECGFTAQPVWMGSGYYCDPTFPGSCPDGTIPGHFSLPGYEPRPYCADANPPASSASSASASSIDSSAGQNSSGNNSDGNGDGSGSSSGNTGNSSSASSTGGGGNSSGSASSGQGGNASSAGAGQCDPTAKNYLECLNSKEINLPNETGSFDGTGQDAKDRIGELEGELGDLIDQIKGEIQDVTGAHLSGSGTLTDVCYTIFKKQVCFGWSRWSSYLSIIGTAIIAAAGVASFIIIMRQ